MGKIIDFNAAKKESATKKQTQNKVKIKNEKLLAKMKKNDQVHKSTAMKYYLIILGLVTIFVVFKTLF